MTLINFEIDEFDTYETLQYKKQLFDAILEVVKKSEMRTPMEPLSLPPPMMDEACIPIPEIPSIPKDCFKCDCGSIIKKSNKTKHLKTLKHHQGCAPH